MRVAVLWTTLLLGAGASHVAARDWHVDAALGDDATGDGSAALPFATIPRAVDLAPVLTGDRVLVAAGTYGAFASRVPCGVSVVGAGSAITFAQPLTSLCVATGDFSAATIEGFTFASTAGGTAFVASKTAPSGGDSRGPTFRDIHFRGWSTAVSAYTRGEGFSIRYEFESCRFEACTTVLALDADTISAGTNRIYMSAYNSVFLANGTVFNIKAFSGGRGFPAYAGVGAWFCTFRDNGTVFVQEGWGEGSAGGSIFSRNSRSFLANSTNRVFGIGGCLFDASPAHFRFIGDFPTGAAIEARGLGSGLYDGDPLLVDPANGDVHLGPGSAALERGGRAGVPGVDFEGDVRPLDADGDGLALWDLGADEAPAGAPTRVRRVDLATIRPPMPPLATALPIGGASPVVLDPLLWDSFDPQSGVLTDPDIQLAFYGLDPPTARWLVLVKHASAGSVRILHR